MTRQALILPWPSRDLSPNARVHWARKGKAAKKYRADCHLLTKAAGITITWDGPAHLWITFYPPDKRARDDDNLIASFKSGRDGIADALGIDDKRFRIHPWVSDEVRKGGAVEVAITAGAEAANRQTEYA
jgi:crossover junction endodeoxyribonuclease RusA